MLPIPDLTAILPTLPTASMVKRLHRVVNLEHYESSDLSQLLFDQGPVRSSVGQRFTPAVPDGFPGIYAAEELVTAGSEYAGTRGNWNQGDCPKFGNYSGQKIVPKRKKPLVLW